MVLHNNNSIPSLFSHIAIFLACLFIFSPASLLAQTDVSAGDTDEDSWETITSNCFIVRHRPDANLPGIERELRARALLYDQAARYNQTTVTEEICYRLDKLFAHVKDILNMYPDIPKVTVKIFRDRDELCDEYFRIYASRRDLSAYYIKDLNTIYTSEVDIGDSVMIHEMAHVIIDHYFVTPPSTKVSEILASYVDANMEE